MRSRFHAIGNDHLDYHSGRTVSSFQRKEIPFTDRSYSALPRALFTIFVLVLAYGPGRADDYPSCELKTEGLRGVIYLPDPVKRFYRGSRFDWSGFHSQGLSPRVETETAAPSHPWL